MRATLTLYGLSWPRKGQKFNLYHLLEISMVFEMRVLTPISRISLWTNNFEFLEQISPKKIFKIKTKNSEHPHWILHIQISLGTEFVFKRTILIFWTKFVQRGKIQSKTEKLNVIIKFCIPDFWRNWQFWFFRLNLPKKSIPVLKQKKLTLHLNSAYSN